LESQVRDLRLESWVTFAGRVDNVAEILPACDLAIMPSLREGFSNALLEAMACGVPVVASDVGGNREAVIQGESGIIVPMRTLPLGAQPELDELAWREAVSGAILSRPRMAEMGLAARRRSEDFSIGRMVSDIEALYLEILQKPSRPLPAASPLLVPSA
jgi:glycosyltransferase involved in cell wall biosynthesis